MKSYVHIRNMAIDLRQSGHSYREISKKLLVSVGILSVWLKGMRLSVEHSDQLKKRVVDKVSRGRMNASIANKSKRMVKESFIAREAEKEFQIYIKDSFFVVGLSLYWAKGGKRGRNFQFLSGDREMLGMMNKWTKTYLKTDSIGVDVLRKVIAWQKLLIKYYDDVPKNQ